MINQKDFTIFLVDDDALLLKSLEIELLHSGYGKVTTFLSGEECVLNLSQCPDLIILDFHLDGINPNAINGLETLNKIKYFKPDIPVVMLSSQDKIEVAVECLHHRALDYVVKSETAFFHLQKIIGTIMRYRKIEEELNWYVDRM